eukprot:Hpha_TRINITY_DN9925_c0_g1::TRINITY_DN9925_c0_g1_i1::g.140487::m.140487
MARIVRTVAALAPQRGRCLAGQRRRRALETESDNPGQTGIELFVGDHYLDHGFSKEPPNPGRAWKKEELAVKSYEDLRKIWFLLLIERNQLKSCELFFQHQSETLGDFPHPSRLDRVQVSMMRVREVIEERHKVATKVAWKEFVRRVSQRYYRYPPGPQPPAEYRNPARAVCIYSRTRMVTDEYHSMSKEEMEERLADRFDMVLNAKVVDIKEELTQDGKERRERCEFLTLQLQKVSRNLLPRCDDLVRSWRVERDELREEGPWYYKVFLADEDTAESVINRARRGEDEVMRLDALPTSSPPSFVEFDDDDHLLVEPEIAALGEPQDELGYYAHILAREEFLIRQFTRPAVARPLPFSKPPTDQTNPANFMPYNHEHSRAQKAYETEGRSTTQYVDAPHPGTTVISGINSPGATGM